MRDKFGKWDVRALVAYILITAIAVVGSWQISGISAQVEQIKRQQCADANTVTVTYVSQFHPHPEPTLRDCR